MTTFFKAVRPDGTDFHSGTIDYAAAFASGEVVEHPNPRGLSDPGARASGYFSVATVPTDCTGFSWPCRLFEVEAVGPVAKDDWFTNKRRVLALRVARELPAHRAFGPQGEYVVALLDRVGAVTPCDAARVAGWDAAEAAALDAAWDAARVAAEAAARVTAWVAGWDAARVAARDAAGALVVRDLISTEHYDTLTLPWRRAVGPIHPDDPEVTR